MREGRVWGKHHPLDPGTASSRVWGLAAEPIHPQSWQKAGSGTVTDLPLPAVFLRCGDFISVQTYPIL